MRGLCYFGLLVVLAVPAGVAALPFERIGPDGGFLHHLVQDSSNPGTVLAYHYGGPVYRTINYGLSWQYLNQDFGISAERVHLTYDPGDSRRLFADADEGQFFSNDAGQTWAQITGGLPDTAILTAFDPANPERMFAIDGGFLWISLDAGQSWSSQVFAYGGDAYVIRSVAVSPTDPATWLVGARFAASPNDRQFFRTSDNGLTFNPIGFLEAQVGRIIFHPSTAQKIYFKGFPQGSAVSSDNGLSWQSMPALSPYQTLRSFSITDDGLHYSRSDGTYYLSPDDGQTGTLIGASGIPESLSDVRIRSDDQNDVVGSGRVGVFFSSDGGVSWDRRVAGMPQSSVTGVFKDHTETSLFVWADLDLYRSENRGRSWMPIGRYADLGNPVDLSSIDDTLLVLTDRGIFGYQGGESWQALHSGQDVDGEDLYLERIIVNPADTLQIFAFGNVMLRSDNGGQDWQSVFETNYFNSVIIQTERQRLLIYDFVLGSLLYDIATGEVTDIDLLSGVYVCGKAIYNTPSMPDRIFTTCPELSYTDDLGQTWVDLGLHRPGGGVFGSATRLEISDQYPQAMLVTTETALDSPQAFGYPPRHYLSVGSGGNWVFLESGFGRGTILGQDLFLGGFNEGVHAYRNVLGTLLAVPTLSKVGMFFLVFAISLIAFRRRKKPGPAR